MINAWEEMLGSFPCYEKNGKFTIPAYSEFMPSPHFGKKPSGMPDKYCFSPADPNSWSISEFEEHCELRPGLENVCIHIINSILDLGNGKPNHFLVGHNKRNLDGNRYWPDELAAHAGHFSAKDFVFILPLSLSKTQDDKGRVQWTLFGSSEQGPEMAFWKSFRDSSGMEKPVSESRLVFANFLKSAYGESFSSADGLLAEKFRILPTIPDAEFPYYTPEKHPQWCESFIWSGGELSEKVEYILTFRPFSDWPEPLKIRYLGGKINVLPFPGSLVFWGSPHFRNRQKKFIWSQQLPLLRILRRHHPPYGVWIQQSGWLFDSLPENEKKNIHPEILLDTYKRTHRFNRVNRYDTDIEESPDKDVKTLQCIFSNSPEIIGLYDKPLARNSRIFAEDGELVLDGPTANRQDILNAAGKIFKGGLYEYMFCYPPMRCGDHEVFWQRPLVAYCQSKEGSLSPVFDFASFNGYLTAYRTDKPDLEKPVDLIPEFKSRKIYMSASLHFKNAQDRYRYQTAINCLKLFHSWELFGKKPLPRRFARRILRLSKTDTIDKWLDSLPERADIPENGREMRSAIDGIIAAGKVSPSCLQPESLHGITLSETATRKYEEDYWNTIAVLAHGRFINKNSADTMLDEATRKELKHDWRDLTTLGSYLIGRHQASIDSAGMKGAAVCGEHSFKWRTESDYPFYNGWLHNREGSEHERNILVVIPGKNRKEAVVMADHYDTAYEEDRYYRNRGGTGARIAARGADDNHSATATLLLAAPIFLKLSKEGKLERDVWLLHLTGEEFPADCLGARNFCEALVGKNLKFSSSSGETDLSGIEVKGVFVLDMIAHNNDHDPDVFQISPGDGHESLTLAHYAHTANEIWNEYAKHLNESGERKNSRRGAKSSDPDIIPEIAPCPHLHGEIRPHYDMKSSLFNTDGQIFSDAGVPVVLFMENYDINRHGYHDTEDTMENIDLDFGAGVSAIAIETVARTACAASIHVR